MPRHGKVLKDNMTKKDSEISQMSIREYMRAIWSVLKISFSISKSSIGFKVISAVLDSVFPLLTAYFAAQTTTQIAAAFHSVSGAKEKALVFVVVTAALGLVTAIQSSLGNYFDQVVRFRVESKISDMLFDRFSQLEFWRYDDKKTADLYEKAKDFSSFFAYIFDRVAQLFQSFIGVTTAILGLGLISPWLSVALFLAIVPGLIVQYKLSRFQIQHWRDTIVERRKQSFIEYNMLDPKTMSELRLNGMAKRLLSMRVTFRNKDQGGRLGFERRFIKWRIISDGLEAIVQLGSLAWVVGRVASKALPIGQFVYVQQLVSRALGSSSSFISQLGSTDEDLAKLKDYNEFMEISTVHSGKTPIKKPVTTIRFEDVSFTYPTSTKEVLSHVTLTIKAGSHIAIVGENGAGKTTFIKLLLGFYKPTNGTIYVDDIPLQDYDIAQWHKQLGVLLQDFTRYQFATIGDNVTFGDVASEPIPGRIDEALRAAEALEIINKLPNKLDTPASTWFEEEEGVHLSGGQWQRIALARNFFRRAPIIVLDEPTSAIDAHAEADIFDRLFNRNNQNTIITISHRLTTIENADCIYVFQDGKIVQVGTHAELSKQKTGEYTHMFRRQLKVDQS